MDRYSSWLTKLRKRAQASGAVSQWSEILANKQGGDPPMWREHLRDILDEKEKASLDLILDLDLISAPAKKHLPEKQQLSLW